jgi:hypothetical protein
VDATCNPFIKSGAAALAIEIQQGDTASLLMRLCSTSCNIDGVKGFYRVLDIGASGMLHECRVVKNDEGREVLTKIPVRIVPIAPLDPNSTKFKIEGLPKKEQPEQLSFRDAFQLITRVGYVILAARNWHRALAQPGPAAIMHVEGLTDQLIALQASKCCIIMLAPDWSEMPRELNEIPVRSMPHPSGEEINDSLNQVVEAAGLPISDEKRKAIVTAATGLTIKQAEDVIAYSLQVAKDYDPKYVLDLKYNAIEKKGTLVPCRDSWDLSNYGGALGLKDHITRELMPRLARADRMKKGIRGPIIIGPPGTGKTLAGRVIATAMGWPLLVLDMGNVFSSLVGSSEGKLREAFRDAEAMAPCVLLIDEIDKGIGGSGGENDGGTSARVRGTFLRWMNDHTTMVLAVGSANDATVFKPEDLRTGRWSGAFWLDTPDAKEREEIIRIHLRLAGAPVTEDRVAVLLEMSEGWTGAEIEGCIDLASVRDETAPVSILRMAARNTFPISRTMGDRIQAMRQFAAANMRSAAVVTKIEDDVPAKKTTRGIELED